VGVQQARRRRQHGDERDLRERERSGAQAPDASWWRRRLLLGGLGRLLLVRVLAHRAVGRVAVADRWVRHRRTNVFQAAANSAALRTLTATTPRSAAGGAAKRSVNWTRLTMRKRERTAGSSAGSAV